MLLILLGGAVVVYGVVRLAQTLEPRQRVVLVLVAIAAIVYAVVKLMELGIVGRATR
jgi:hypothetical protein